MPKPRDAQTDADHEGRILTPPKTKRRTEKMEIRVKIETVSKSVAFSKWEKVSASDLAYLRETYRGGLNKLATLTLETETGPLYINPAHIVAIQIEERP